MSDLGEFVLQCISEDEWSARDLLRRAQEAELWLRSPQWLGDEVPGSRSWGDVQSLAERMLADCESKRRILRLCGVDPHQPGTLLLRVQTDAIVRLLAEAHAHHPDYREEWRP